MTNNFKSLKIGDFGLVKDTKNSVAKTFAGTQNYMGPEYVRFFINSYWLVRRWRRKNIWKRR